MATKKTAAKKAGAKKIAKKKVAKKKAGGRQEDCRRQAREPEGSRPQGGPQGARAGPDRTLQPAVSIVVRRRIGQLGSPSDPITQQGRLTGCERLSRPRAGNLSTPSKQLVLKSLPIAFLSCSVQNR